MGWVITNLYNNAWLAGTSKLAATLLVISALALTWTGVAFAAEHRVALVIGNNKYQYAPVLSNSVGDARAIKTELESRGFEVVFAEDANRHIMNAAIEDFLAKLSSDSLALIYYSGHGVQINSSNYLIPIDLKAERSSDVVDDGIDLGHLLERVSQADTKFTLAVVDACRDNPFKGEDRSFGGRGLAPPISNASGIMVVYSAGANQEAIDRLGPSDRDPNGLFTREFLKAIRMPGLRVQEVVDIVKQQVIEEAKTVGHVQTPAIYDQSTGSFTFTPTVAGGPREAAVSLEDLATQNESLRVEWDRRQKAMQADFERVAAFLGPPELRRAAWDRFLAAYTDKNPYSDVDDKLRSEAVSRRAAIHDLPTIAYVPPKSDPAPAPTMQSRATNEILDGSWQGVAEYDNGRQAPIVFQLDTNVKGNQLTGRMSEKNTFAKGYCPTLYASVGGSISGQRIHFIKTYDGTCGVSHSVEYDGLIDVGGRSISGRWQLPGGGGQFRMSEQ